MNDFSANLRTIRQTRKLTQADLATYLGVSLSCIQKWEQGQRTPKKLTQDAITLKLRRIHPHHEKIH